MQVAVAHYDVRNGGEGVELFASQELAIEAVISWCLDASLIGQSSFQITEDEARAAMLRGEGLVFETMETYYSVEMMEVQTHLKGCEQEEALEGSVEG